MWSPSPSPPLTCVPYYAEASFTVPLQRLAASGSAAPWHEPTPMATIARAVEALTQLPLRRAPRRLAPQNRLSAYPVRALYGIGADRRG